MHAWLQDLRYALRILAKSPGFVLVAVLSLALGIGLNSAVFSMVEAVFLRSWPASDPAGLVKLVARTQQDQDEEEFSYVEYGDISGQISQFSGVLAYSRHGRFIGPPSESRFIFVDIVSPNYFSVLGLSPTAGRFMSPSDAPEQQAQTVVISYAVWQRDFGGDRTLVGRKVMLSGEPYVVIGIAPRGFRGLEKLVPTDAWFPTPGQNSSAGANAREFRDYEVVARLRHPEAPAAARAQLAVLGAQLAVSYPESEKGRSLGLTTERDRRGQEWWPAFLMLSVVGLVLLVACANVAGLVLARAETRRREIAVRTALGASRGQIVRLLLAEGLVLAAIGAALGMAFTWLVIRLQPLFMPPALGELSVDMHLGGPVLVFTVAIALGSAVIFSLAPLARSARGDLVSTLKGDDTSFGVGRHRLSLRDLLVAGQIAVAVVLLCGTGLLLRSLAFSSRIHTGFDHGKNLLFLELAPSLAGYSDQRSVPLMQQISEHVAAVPGVKRVSFAWRALLSGSGGGASMKVFVPGEAVAPELQNVQINFNAVSPGYFQTVGTRILQGRDFTQSDVKGAVMVAVISEAMARRYWPDAQALGRRLLVDGKEAEVIGVAENATVNRIHEFPQPYLYLFFAQLPSNEATLMVEIAGNPGASLPAIRHAVSAVDAKVIVLEALTLTELMHFALWQERMAAGLAASLCGVGVFLAMVGLYGVIAYFVQRRAHEIGIRMALGAQRSHVRKLVLAQGGRLALAGTFAGVITALAVTRLMSSYLYGVEPVDLPSFACAAALAMAVALAACFFPAQRACKVDPMIALRSQ